MPSDQFVCVHKSFIVAISGIQAIENNRIFIADGIIPIGDTYHYQSFSMVEKIGWGNN
ncbi:MAG: hypothetical protein EPN37_02835 [Chitinophagaceae bacterium]|nr:MAG: hypothetical protein EPN37_02835 [Chitinophagaceae bacterium]